MFNIKRFVEFRVRRSVSIVLDVCDFARCLPTRSSSWRLLCILSGLQQPSQLCQLRKLGLHGASRGQVLCALLPKKAEAKVPGAGEFRLAFREVPAASKLAENRECEGKFLVAEALEIMDTSVVDSRSRRRCQAVTHGDLDCDGYSIRATWLSKQLLMSRPSELRVSKRAPKTLNPRGKILHPGCTRTCSGTWPASRLPTRLFRHLRHKNHHDSHKSIIRKLAVIAGTTRV